MSRLTVGQKDPVVKEVGGAGALLSFAFNRAEDRSLKERLALFEEKGVINKRILAFTSDNAELFRLRSQKSKYLLSKRLFDFWVSLFLIVLFSPLFVLAALAVKFSSAGPIFFRQERVGENYRVFSIFKFRTMEEGAERVVRKNSLPLEKVAANNKTTRVGAFLRKWKIDELPQLLNVVKSEMSLVGPRPFTLEDSACCPKQYKGRFSIKPGMTGYWQAYFDNTISYLHKFRLDHLYAQKCGWFFDLKILLKTPYRVLRGEKSFAAYQKQEGRVA